MRFTKMWCVVSAVVLAGAILTGCGKISRDKRRGIKFSDDNRTLVSYRYELPDKSYTVPDGVTEIGRGAFKYARNLETVILPAGVKGIEAEAFDGCERLTSITIPRQSYIGTGTFRGCKSLTHVTIPAGVIGIKAEAFAGCESLESITLPPGLTSIGYRAFKGCKRLTRVTIPSSVTDIAYNAFDDCPCKAQVRRLR